MYIYTHKHTYIHNASHGYPLLIYEINSRDTCSSVRVSKRTLLNTLYGLLSSYRLDTLKSTLGWKSIIIFRETVLVVVVTGTKEMWGYRFC